MPEVLAKGWQLLKNSTSVDAGLLLAVRDLCKYQRLTLTYRHAVPGLLRLSVPPRPQIPPTFENAMVNWSLIHQLGGSYILALMAPLFRAGGLGTQRECRKPATHLVQLCQWHPLKDKGNHGQDVLMRSILELVQLLPDDVSLCNHGLSRKRAMAWDLRVVGGCDHQACRRNGVL